MSELSTADIAARVVAWHNRHLLARRLTLADVFSVGHVALPYRDPTAPPPAPDSAAAGAASLRERAMARSREAPAKTIAAAAGGPLQPAFHDDFIPPLSPAEVAAFGAQHGIERPHDPGAAALRRVPAQVGSGGLTWRWLLTAEMRAGGTRTRVLLGPVPGAPVLGRRLWSLPRVGALAALAGAAVALALALGLLPGLGIGDGTPPVAVMPGATAPVAAARPLPAPPPASAAVAAASAASAASPAINAVAPPTMAASRPIDVEPRLGKIDLPSIGDVVDARRRREAEAAASAALQAAATTAASAPGRSAVAPAAPGTPVFGLSTRLLRTRTESQQIAEALTLLLVVPGSPVQHVDVLEAGDDFRVVAWPYAGRAEAERAQAALLARGHRLQLISF